MQGNGKISFEIEGVKHSLYFGMTAAEIVSKESVKLAGLGATDLQAFASIFHAGMCNQADSQLLPRPEFQEAYFLCESIASDNDLTTKIYSAWTDSKAGSELMKLMGGVKKKVEESQNQQTGT